MTYFDLTTEQYQVIKAKDLNVQLGSGFGYSLSKEITDVDSNKFNYFAVGAPFGESDSAGFSESAVVLRSRPVVSFDLQHVFIYNVPDQDPSVKGNNHK